MTVCLFILGVFLTQIYRCVRLVRVPVRPLPLFSLPPSEPAGQGGSRSVYVAVRSSAFCLYSSPRLGGCYRSPSKVEPNECLRRFLSLANLVFVCPCVCPRFSSVCVVVLGKSETQACLRTGYRLFWDAWSFEFFEAMFLYRPQCNSFLTVRSPA